MYTLVAVGFTLFFGVLGLINFAHGEVFMLGAFAALFVARLLQQHRRARGLVSGGGHVRRRERVLRCGRHAVTERLAYRPVRRSPMLIMLITSLGVSFLMRESVKEFFPEGANPLAFPSPYMARRGAVRFGRRQLHADLAYRCLDHAGGGALCTGRANVVREVHAGDR